MSPLDEAHGEAEDDATAELFSCGICGDVFLDPTTLTCCGKTFCRRCLRQWIHASVHTAGVPRCPGGCAAKLPFRLPARSHALRDAVEQLLPAALARRQREAEEDDEGEVDVCYGGLRAWQEVAANRDIIFGTKLGVRQGTPGILLGNYNDGSHVTVKFDEREDGSELCVNVLPEALMAPLPCGFRLGQRVVALFDLMLFGELGVRLGTSGSIVGRLNEDRLMVLFDSRVDGGTNCAQGPVSVGCREVAALRPLVGGFAIAQRVQASLDLVVGDKVVVRAGTRGCVLGEFSDTRLTVVFDAMVDGGVPGCFNVLPLEIWPWCDPPEDLPVGTMVEAAADLVSASGVVVRAGVRGAVLGGVESPAQLLVRFHEDELVSDAPLFGRILMVDTSVVRKVDADGSSFAGSTSRIGGSAGGSDVGDAASDSAASDDDLEEREAGERRSTDDGGAGVRPRCDSGASSSSSEAETFAPAEESPRLRCVSGGVSDGTGGGCSAEAPAAAESEAEACGADGAADTEVAAANGESPALSHKAGSAAAESSGAGGGEMELSR